MQRELAEFKKNFEERLAAAKKEKIKIVLKEQYSDAFDILADC